MKELHLSFQDGTIFNLFFSNLYQPLRVTPRISPILSLLLIEEGLLSLVLIQWS
jgi:hypothetical protein